MCRILYLADNDSVASKKQASNWVKKTYIQWNDLIEEAENWKHGITLDKQEETKLFIEFVVKKSKEQEI